MAVKIYSATLNGLDAEVVETEVQVSSGLPGTAIVGLADTSIKESKERLRAALKNSIYKYPLARVTVNLAPANIFKYGTHFDLPITLGILLDSGQIGFNPNKIMFFGELSLQGEVRPIVGVLPLVLCAKDRGFNCVFIPDANYMEASLVSGIKIIGVKSLEEVVNILGGAELPEREHFSEIILANDAPDISDIVGQQFAKRGLEIALAGGHNILLTGPPGSRKTMLARCAVSLLPPLTEKEKLEVAKISSIAGTKNYHRPYRNPNRSVTLQSFIGGGRIPKPGELSLAHNGILFMDEFPEFTREIIESLREPLEQGTVKIFREQGRYEFPAKFIFIAARNPCPCGYFNVRGKICSCSPGHINNYQRRISGPILDRIDLQINVQKLDSKKFQAQTAAESSSGIRQRIFEARTRQLHRAGKLNSALGSKEIEEYCALNSEAVALLEAAQAKYDFSMRTYHRILKLSRTIADLAAEKEISSSAVAEAIQYRLG